MPISLREEFRVENFCFSYPKSSPFFSSQWQCCPAMFTLYRLGVALYTTGWFIAILVEADAKARKAREDPTPTTQEQEKLHCTFAYISMWNYTFLVLQFILAFIINILSWATGRKHSASGNSIPLNASKKSTSGIDNSGSEVANNSPMKQERVEANMEPTVVDPPLKSWYMKLSWALFTVNSVMAVVVTVGFFGGVFKKNLSMYSWNQHVVNSVLVFVDNIISAVPIRPLHVIYPAIYGLVYVIFNVIYWSMDRDKNVLYKGVLDWDNKTGMAMITTSLIVFVGPIVLTILYYGLHRFKLWGYRKIYHYDYK